MKAGIGHPFLRYIRLRRRLTYSPLSSIHILPLFPLSFDSHDEMTIPPAAAAAVFLALIVVAAEGLGSAATIAVIQSSGTVCGVLAGDGREKIRCARVGQPVLAIAPKLSFKEISGGRDFFCGLSSGGLRIFCWAIKNFSAGLVSTKRIYNGPFPLADLSVGVNQVCALDKNRTKVLCWRGDGSFPASVAGEYRSLTSGRGFSCGIGIDNRVKCWGGRGTEFQNSFGNITMQSIVAGDSHVCGIGLTGFLICKGSNSSGQLNVPSGGAFEFSGLALGLNHSCVIKQPNGTVLCWGADAGGVWSYSQENSMGFEFIVAGDDLTCGVITDNFTVMCWNAGGINHSYLALPLPQILPGRCVVEESSCKCGVFPDSESLCSDSGVICKSCGAPFISQPPPEPPSQPASPPPVPESAPIFSKSTKGWLAFCITGSVGGLVAIFSILCCIWSAVCRNKKVHNSSKASQPAILTAGNIPTNSAQSSISIPAPLISPSGSRSRVLRRYISRATGSHRRGPSSFKERAEEFTFDDLATATNNFSLECRIGTGSFGTVYKGMLKNNREVAIKRGELRSSLRNKKFLEKERAFQSELVFLSRLHHKHLVDLVGYCEERDERLLVYEYMKNGALFDHLHSRTGTETGPMDSWRMRIKVLLDAARGIEYLHNYAVPPIIHRDIKSSNILLDGDWVARVSDFGLSLMGPEAEEAHPSMMAAGTMGYIDPEYYGGIQQLTTKSDVYGFGVVMLEILTGRRAIFREEGEECGEPVSVVEYAAPIIDDGEAWRVLDRRMPRPELREAEAVELLAYTAVHCVSMKGKDRPTITDVVMNLESALALCDTRKEDSWSSSNMSFSSRD
ncbi:hypothetical protein KFK09_020611 [Dendrobium nobile]|uniref:Protein kinase domain-containing protein n=1 Tax=Dendrobium nobile TaxID=94219 RepID=A0A8T3AMB7_DENNO|nr:hypothetical protein KFK09_020611 [Dendrobium nobile]